jgi:hypothetical protein
MATCSYGMQPSVDDTCSTRAFRTDSAQPPTDSQRRHSTPAASAITQYGPLELENENQVETTELLVPVPVPVLVLVTVVCTNYFES